MSLPADEQDTGAETQEQLVGSPAEPSREGMSFLERIYSVPIYFKVLGIGALLGLFFGAVTYTTIRTSMYRTHYEIHSQGVLKLAQSIAEDAAPLIRAGAYDTLREQVTQKLQTSSDIRYVVIQDSQGEVLVHDFRFPGTATAENEAAKKLVCAACHSSPEELPPARAELPVDSTVPGGELRVFQRPQGVIFEIRLPVDEGRLGVIRVGSGDKIIPQEIAAVSRALVLSLFVYFVLGMAALFGFTYIIAHPLGNLLAVTNRIRAGDFEARARVFANDEIGKLARTFNLMVAEVQNYRQKVTEKEIARLSLIEQLVRVQEDERKIMARELHDQLGQSLSMVLLLVQQLGRGQVEPKEGCDTLEEHVRILLDSVKQLAWDIRPSILDDYGLALALQRYAERLSLRSEVNVDFQELSPPGAPRLPSHIEVPLYRVAQEALTNVIRHAGATNASVVLIRNAREITLIIEDDGVGFDTVAVQARDEVPFGLTGMSERIALIGGELGIESVPGSGTTVQIRVPMEEPAA